MNPSTSTTEASSSSAAPLPSSSSGQQQPHHPFSHLIKPQHKIRPCMVVLHDIKKYPEMLPGHRVTKKIGLEQPVANKFIHSMPENQITRKNTKQTKNKKKLKKKPVESEQPGNSNDRLIKPENKISPCAVVVVNDDMNHSEIVPENGVIEEIDEDQNVINDLYKVVIDNVKKHLKSKGINDLSKYSNAVFDDFLEEPNPNEENVKTHASDNKNVILHLDERLSELVLSLEKKHGIHIPLGILETFKADVKSTSKEIKKPLFENSAYNWLQRFFEKNINTPSIDERMRLLMPYYFEAVFNSELLYRSKDEEHLTTTQLNSVYVSLKILIRYIINFQKWEDLHFFDGLTKETYEIMKFHWNEFLKFIEEHGIADSAVGNRVDHL